MRRFTRILLPVVILALMIPVIVDAKTITSRYSIAISESDTFSIGDFRFIIASDTLTIDRGGTVWAKIDTTGNVYFPEGTVQIGRGDTTSYADLQILDADARGYTQLYVGEEDTGDISYLTASGAGTGTTTGGVLNLQNSADHDGTVDYWSIMSKSGNLKISEDGGTTVNVHFDTTGKVGIGDETPEFTMDVQGSIGGSDYLYHQGDTDTYLGFDAADAFLMKIGNETILDVTEDGSQDIIELGDDGDIDIKLSAGADGALFVQGSSGNVGIGTASPTFLLNLEHSSGDDCVLGLHETTGVTTGKMGRVVFGNSDVDVALVDLAGYQDGATDAGGLIIRTEATGASLTEKMRITSAGNVGIGTTSPLEEFQVESTTPAMVWSDSDAGADSTIWRIIANSGVMYFATRTDINGAGQNFMQVSRTGGATIDYVAFPNGNVGIGTTSPGEKFEVSGTTKLDGRVGIETAPGDNVGLYMAGNTLGTGTAQYGIFCEPIYSSAATVSGSAGYFRHNTQAASFTQTSGYGLYVADSDKGAGSTITNLYGLYVADQTQGGTKNYGIYSAGTTNDNYFGGNVGIGDTSPEEELDVVGNVNIDSDSTGYDIHVGNATYSRMNAGDANFTTSSDSSLKENQTFIEDVLDSSQVMTKVLNTPVYRYNWKKESLGWTDIASWPDSVEQCDTTYTTQTILDSVGVDTLLTEIVGIDSVGVDAILSEIISIDTTSFDTSLVERLEVESIDSVGVDTVLVRVPVSPEGKYWEREVTYETREIVQYDTTYVLEWDVTITPVIDTTITTDTTYVAIYDTSIVYEMDFVAVYDTSIVQDTTITCANVVNSEKVIQQERNDEALFQSQEEQWSFHAQDFGGNFNGSPQAKEVDWQQVSMIQWYAIQELIRKIEDHETRITKLEGKVRTLEAAEIGP